MSKDRRVVLKPAHVALGVALCGVPMAVASDIEVLVSEIPDHPTSLIPDAVDLSGTPVSIRYKSLEGFTVSPDGTQWLLRGRADSDANYDTFMVHGIGSASNMLAQEGQPVHGGAPGEVYDFFDPVAGFNSMNHFAFGARVRGGNNSVFEKVMKYDGSSIFIAHQMGDPALGLIDSPPANSGDETFGNSINAIHLMDDGTVGFHAATINNIHSTRRPANFHGNMAVAQNGITMVSELETLSGSTGGIANDSFSSSLDGNNFLYRGQTNNPDSSLRAVLVINNEWVVRQNTEIGNTGVTCSTIVYGKMGFNGDWVARGLDTQGRGWALLNGDIIGLSGDPVAGVPLRGQPVEAWASGNFFGVAANTKGDYVLVGATTNGDPAADTVIALNGQQVVVREGDPVAVDLDNNGQFDDAFIGRSNNTLSPFASDSVHLTDDLVLYFVASLVDADGNDLQGVAFGSGGQALLRIDLKQGSVCVGDIAPKGGDGMVNVDDLLAVIGNWGPCSGCAADTNGDDVVNVDDLLTVIGTWGACE